MGKGAVGADSVSAATGVTLSDSTGFWSSVTGATADVSCSVDATVAGSAVGGGG
jgi:hypothetical protein